MNREDPLAFDSSWPEAQPSSAFHVMPLASPLYPTSQYTMPEHLARYSPMPFGVANTNDGGGTDFHPHLLSPAHAQHGLARDAQDAHKQGFSCRTKSNSQTRAVFAGPCPDFDPQNLFPMPAQIPVQIPVRDVFLAPVPRNDNPFIHQGDTVAVDRNNLTPDDSSLQSPGFPSVSSPSHHDSPETPLFNDAVIPGENRHSDVDWSEYLVFDADSDLAMSMGFPELICPTPDPDGDIAVSSPLPSSPRRQEANSSNTTMGCQPNQHLDVDQINATGPGSPSTHSPSPDGISGKRKRPSFHAADTQPQVQLSPYRLGTALQSPHTRKDADIEIESTLLDTLDSEGRGFLADRAPRPLPSNDMTFRRPAVTDIFWLADDLTRPSPTQASSVPPTQAVHANSATLQQTPDHPASPVAESTNGDGHVRASCKRRHVHSSDSAIYTCTYHGCPLRFETPRKLQKHKREAHRQTIAGQNRDASLPSLAESQAGRYRCKYVNPSTDKQCQSTFSRPYDLTRHEGTTHAHKEKLRCQRCSAEKTFTRNDALTRHMRIMHPEVS